TIYFVKRISLLVSILLLSIISNAQILLSPSNKLKLEFNLNQDGTPTYQLSYKDKLIIKPSKLGLELTNHPKKNVLEEEGYASAKIPNHSLYDNFNIVGEKKVSFDETWKPVWGEESEIRNNYNELLITL